jgi:hypothetical protein
VYAGSRGQRIVTDCDVGSESFSVREANARLISSAPDLLEALKACQHSLAMMTAPAAIQSTSVMDAWTHAVAAETKARAAITLATGDA